MFAKLIILFHILLSHSVSVEYDIVEFYKGITPEDGTVVLTTFNNVEKAELILIPINLTPGNYQAKITRKAKDLYNIDGSNIFIKTRFCNEYSINADVHLIVASFPGDSQGKIIFK